MQKQLTPLILMSLFMCHVLIPEKRQSPEVRVWNENTAVAALVEWVAGPVGQRSSLEQRRQLAGCLRLQHCTHSYLAHMLPQVCGLALRRAGAADGIYLARLGPGARLGSCHRHRGTSEAGGRSPERWWSEGPEDMLPRRGGAGAEPGQGGRGRAQEAQAASGRVLDVICNGTGAALPGHRMSMWAKRHSG